MSNSRDITSLNARSLALSALLGTHPPRLAASSLVALAELFGINGGTMRTALSRLASAGDIVADSGRYALTPRLAERQAAQDVGRREPAPWDGTWHTAIALADQRDLPERRRVRAAMVNGRFAELRPTVWLRPANLAVPPLGDDHDDWLVVTGPIDDLVGRRLVRDLWDLDAIASQARRWDHELVAEGAGDSAPADPATIPERFVLSANVLRFLRSEPSLPIELTPPDWPVDALRRRYVEFERSLQATMRPFLRAHDG